MFQTVDLEKQHELLNRVSEMIVNGTLISTVTNNLGTLSAETLKEAHALPKIGTDPMREWTT